MWILGGGAGEREGDASVEKLRGVVDSLGGEVDEIEPWGKRNLSYPINKQTEGYYLLAQFKMESLRAPELDRAILADRDVIRHLIVRK